MSAWWQCRPSADGSPPRRSGGWPGCAGAAPGRCHHFAAGRPDQEDRRELTDFAAEIRRRLDGETTLLPDLPGSRPYRANGGLPLHPQGTGACTGCGQCAKICPVQAIDPAHPRKTDKDRCITCMACVARCPRKARRLNPFMQFVAGQKMKKVCGGRKPNALF